VGRQVEMRRKLRETRRKRRILIKSTRKRLSCPNKRRSRRKRRNSLKEKAILKKKSKTPEKNVLVKGENRKLNKIRIILTLPIKNSNKMPKKKNLIQLLRE
jgi:hypothetical protein